MKLKIKKNKDSNLSDFAQSLLKKYYLLNNETPQQGFARAAIAFSGEDEGLAQRIYDYVSNQWLMYASPILSNAPALGKQPKGLPVSCFLTYVPDTLDGLIDHSTELKWLSVKGGGVAGHWSDIRSISDIAPGPIPFLKTVDSDIVAYRQGKTRKGSYAAYLNVNHPDIIEFLNIRVPTGGDKDRKCLNLNNAVNITDDFMQAVMDDTEWSLIDPNDHQIKSIVPARKLWERILEIRFRTGEPYLNFIDEANRQLPKSLSDKGLRIHGSNLCNEIHLPTSAERTAVCCLSSLNLEKYDEWKNTEIVQDSIRFLDNVLEFFIQNAPKCLSKAIYSATRERSIGLGTMGFHYYLQKNNIPFESALARSINRKIFEDINKKAIESTEQLAKERGEYPDGVGTGRRNSHLLAIAPNANNSIIAGTSPSIEPIKSNAFTHRTRAGAFLVKNRYLTSLLDSKNINNDEIWSSIITNKGSVQHLDCLNEHEKQIFKTAFEIDQRWVVEHAADRQPHICQGQSVNLFFPANSQKYYVNDVHLLAWKKKLKGLYYLRTEAGHDAEKVSNKVELSALKEHEECLGCEG